MNDGNFNRFEALGERMTKPPVVKLVGADGNAFNVIGLCRRAAKKAGWSQARIDALIAEMTSGDYDNVLGTAMKYFDVR